MINVGIIGTGRWGKNLVRNFARLKDCKLSICCDLNEKLLAKIKDEYPGTKTTTKVEDVIADTTIDAVAIAASSVATPATVAPLRMASVRLAPSVTLTEVR